MNTSKNNLLKDPEDKENMLEKKTVQRKADKVLQGGIKCSN